MNQRNRWSHIVAVLSLGLAVMCTTARAQVFSTPPTNVSNNSDFSFPPQVAVDLSGNIYSGNIYVVWEDDTATANILFKRSTDGGATFSTPTNLSNGLGSSFNPRMAVDAHGNINVVWEDNTPGNGRIFFNRSTDGGATFLPTPVKLSDELADSTSPQIAVDTKGNINVVWENDGTSNGKSHIFFTRLVNGDPTPPNQIIDLSSKSLDDCTNPQLALDASGNINVSWEDKPFGSN